MIRWVGDLALNAPVGPSRAGGRLEEKETKKNAEAERSREGSRRAKGSMERPRGARDTIPRAAEGPWRPGLVSR